MLQFVRKMAEDTVNSGQAVGLRIGIASGDSGLSQSASASSRITSVAIAQLRIEEETPLGTRVSLERTLSGPSASTVCNDLRIGRMSG